jgi:anti-sigma B factor antagonist
VNIKIEKTDNNVVFFIEGRIDTTTAPLLTERLQNELAGVASLELNLEKVDYISSAGLRAILLAQKIMDKQGKMILKGVREEVMEVFDITGFSSILDFA